MSLEVSKMSDKELVELYKGLWGCIFVTNCFSISDLFLLKLVSDELRKRGYKVVVKEECEVVKDDKEG